MKTDLKMKFNNEYHIELIDSSTGEVKQEGLFHNLVLNDIHGCICGKSSADSTFSPETYPERVYGGMFRSLTVGSGTTEPAVTQNGLVAPLWTVVIDGNDHPAYTWIDDHTIRASGTFTFPATSSYVGTVREVGLRSWDGRGSATNYPGVACTRALLTDSEGQPISFDKTDTDILKVTVTVEMSMYSSTENFKLFYRPGLLKHIVAGTYSTFDSYPRGIHGDLNLARFEYDMTSKIEGTKYDMHFNETTKSVVCAAKLGESYVRYTSRRLTATEVTNETYYKAVSLPMVGYWMLPNEEVFPAYPIQNISVGTGDGVSTSFINPLSYFKAGTDKVYKNGVLLTRGVDYSINNVGNVKCLPELAPIPTKIYSDFTSDISAAITVPFLPSALKQSNVSKFSRTFKSGAPLYIEYEDAVTMNCLRLVGKFVYFTGSSSSNIALDGGTVYLDASDDGVTYYEVASKNLAASMGSFTVDFVDTTAKYWRLRLPVSHSKELGIGPSDYILLNKKDPYIVFAEAPADGDLITMDVEMDIIMKNSNFVLDIGCQVNFTT